MSSVEHKVIYAFTFRQMHTGVSTECYIGGMLRRLKYRRTEKCQIFNEGGYCLESRVVTKSIMRQSFRIRLIQCRR